MRSRRRWLILLIMGTGLPGCLLHNPGPSAARIDCLNHCAAWNDRCLLDARDSAAITNCDYSTHSCVNRCPPQ